MEIKKKKFFYRYINFYYGYIVNFLFVNKCSFFFILGGNQVIFSNIQGVYDIFSLQKSLKLNWYYIMFNKNVDVYIYFSVIC